MQDRPYNVLFICTGNSARSILAEALLTNFGGDRFKVYSAGSCPSGAVNPMALQALKALRLPGDGFRSKSWSEFAQPDSPPLDFIITVCDKAAGEECPVWPGQPITAHWGVPDPAAVEGPQEARAKHFMEAAKTLKRRIDLMLCLPIEKLDTLALKHEMNAIGKSGQAMTTNVLILCTHNSARSVLSEGMLNHWAKKLGKDVRAHSAGSAPSGRINPMALKVLGEAAVETCGYRSKSWDEFTGPGAPEMRIVITVCDSAAAEQCPYWPGGPVKVHWGYPDPSNAADADKANAFELTRQAIGYRMLQLLQLPLDQMSNPELQQALEEISRN